MLPIVIAQDVLTIWTYRRDLERLEPEDHAAQHGGRHRASAALFAASLTRRAYPARDRPDRRRCSCCGTGSASGSSAAVHAQRVHRRPVRRDRRLHHACWPTPAARPGRCTCCRRGSTSSPTSARSRILFALSNVIKMPAYGALGQLTAENLLVAAALLPVAVAANYRGHLAGAPHLDRAVLPHRLCADVLDRGRTDPQLGRRPVVALSVQPCGKPGGARAASAALTARRPPRTVRDDHHHRSAVLRRSRSRPWSRSGCRKGGFAGIGMVATPLLALVMPPLEAAAILLPIILLQDAMSRLGLSPRLERLESEGDAAGRGGRRRRRLAVRRLRVRTPMIRIFVGLIAHRVRAAWSLIARRPAGAAAAERAARRVLGRARRLHLDADPGRRAALPDLRAAAAAGEDSPWSAPRSSSSRWSTR